MSQIRHTVLSNGLDFVLKGLEELGNYEGSGDINCLKYVTLHIDAGIELILKSKLLEEHWSLVFEQPHNAKKKAYQDGDFSSVSLASSIKRLKDVCDISISKVQEDKINALHKKRNVMQHFEINDTEAAIIGIIASALEVMMDFLREYFDEDNLTGAELKLSKNIRSEIIELQTYIKQRMTVLQAELSKYNEPWIAECPNCGQRAAILDNELPGIRCLFCEYEHNSEKDSSAVADEFAEYFLGLSSYEYAKNGEEWPVYNCPSCSSFESFIMSGDVNICVVCGNEGEYSYCCECGQPHSGEMDICSSCFSEKVNYAK
ncbi:hypothetical protein [Anaerospora hongkongensis]|uniref:hypothetical protein n=1 Tax=Anaerospora hongkongensis TaxID=244830 RepID=UPI002FD8A13C